MNKAINDKVNEIIKNNRIGFMGHIIAGFPNHAESMNAGLGICEGRADFLEVQFPFSDPTADGPIIEGACYQAINNGFTIDSGFKLVKELSLKTNTILIIMTYANIIYKYGIKKFVVKAKESGANGLIIPDIPIENDEGLNTLCNKNNIANILIVTPGSSTERILQLSEIGSGFLYTVARRGITGKKSEIDDETKNYLKKVKDNSKLPIAVGFGIRTNEQIKALKDYCSIAIVGSHFVNIINESYKTGKNIKESLKMEMKNLL